MDSGGNVYFIDNNFTVRKVTPSGILSTVAGGGTATADGALRDAGIDPAGRIAVDAAGNLYIADYFTSAIRKVTNGVIATIAGWRPWASAAMAVRPRWHPSTFR